MVRKIATDNSERRLLSDVEQHGWQNPQAVGVYLHEGFEVVGRSPVDGQGRAFPLLEMRLR